MVKFSYGIDLNISGQIENTIIGNISPKSKVTIIQSSYDNENAYFSLRIEGKVGDYDGMEGPTENYSDSIHLFGPYDDGLTTAFFNENITIPFYVMPTYSGGGGGESGVFPYDQ